MERNNKLEGKFITWSPELSVGIGFIDDQHKILVKLMNDLASHTEADMENERLYSKSVIKELLDYVKVHFITEEELMLQTDFQGYDEHKSEHENFVLKVVDLVKDFNNNKSLAMETLTAFLKKWILHHIAGTDKKYSGYFKEHGINADGPNPLHSREMVSGK